MLEGIHCISVDKRHALDTYVRNFPLILFHVGRRGTAASEEGQNVS